MDGFGEIGTAHFKALVQAGYEREIHGYGLADGMRRRAIDPAYQGEPAYLEGHAIGLRLDQVDDDDKD